MARYDKDFVLLDESIVDYGYRCLMSGASLAEFAANPVMLLMHLRPTASMELPEPDVMLPIGKWYDIRIEGARLLAKPEFDDDDPLAIRVEKKVRKGYLNAASVWVDPIAVSDDDNLKLPGQSGPTITKWGVRESSIVDIPGCRNAIAIRDGEGKLLKLNSADRASQPAILAYLESLISPNKNDSNMDKKLICVRLGLPDTATDKEIDEKLAGAVSNAQHNTRLAGENEALTKKVQDLENAENIRKVEALVDSAIGASKLAAGDREAYIKLATADFDTTKSVIDKMKPYESIEGKLASSSATDKLELESLNKLSGRELYLAGKLERLKELSVEAFKLKYKEYFGKDFTA